ncbi:hypothetical protein [Streptomyces sp. NPDC085529]
MARLRLPAPPERGMTDFPEALDGWTADDWRECRERVSDGESTL